MEELIRFRLLSDSLFQNEYEILLPKIIKSIDKSTLISALFYHFLKNQNERMKIQEINDEISEIIQQRCKSKEEEKSTLPTPQMDKINISLINEISSWLDLKSLSYFERCNRTMFIASRSPTQLHDVDDNALDDYMEHCRINNQLIDPNRFRNVKCLTMGDMYTDQHQQPLSKADQIHKITHYPYKEAPDLYQSNYIKLDNIDTLTMYYWEGTYSEGDVTQLLKSLPNLKNLELTDFDFKQITFHDKDKFNVFRKLECLSLNHFMNGNQNEGNADNDAKQLTIFDICKAQQIKSLHTDFKMDQLIKCKEYIHLKELCLQVRTVDHKLVAMINCFKQLERVYIDVGFDESICHEKVGKFLDVLFNLNTVEYIGVHMHKNADLMMMIKLIQSSLVTMKTNKKHLKIFVQISSCVIYDGIYLDFLLLINSLNNGISKDFMLIVKMNNKDNFHHKKDVTLSEKGKLAIKQWLGNLDIESFNVYDEYDTGCLYFVVSNKKCKINGYTERWFMNCSFCD